MPGTHKGVKLFSSHALVSCSCLARRVSFKLELTTPACPIKDEFERKARDYVSAIPWVSQVGPTLCSFFSYAVVRSCFQAVHCGYTRKVLACTLLPLSLNAWLGEQPAGALHTRFPRSGCAPFCALSPPNTWLRGESGRLRVLRE